jgi:hypothetical protein
MCAQALCNPRWSGRSSYKNGYRGRSLKMLYATSTYESVWGWGGSEYEPSSSVERIFYSSAFIKHVLLSSSLSKLGIVFVCGEKLIAYCRLFPPWFTCSIIWLQHAYKYPLRTGEFLFHSDMKRRITFMLLFHVPVLLLWNWTEFIIQLLWMFVALVNFLYALFVTLKKERK